MSRLLEKYQINILIYGYSQIHGENQIEDSNHTEKQKKTVSDKSFALRIIVYSSLLGCSHP